MKTSTRWIVAVFDTDSTNKVEWYGLFRQEKDATRVTIDRNAVSIEIQVSLENEFPELITGHSADWKHQQHLSIRSLFVIKDDDATDGAEWYGLLRGAKDALYGVRDRPGIAIEVVVDTSVTPIKVASVSLLS